MKKYPTPKATLKKLLPTVTENQINQLETFVDLLQKWNQRYNLISRKDIDKIWEHHILPSLIPLTLTDFHESCWILDIGSGGGLPAIPIKIIRPDLQMLLVDSVRKKTLFLQKITSDLRLTKISVMRERIETLTTQSDLREQFDVVTARAVANIPQLYDWSKPFLKRSSFMFLWKGYSDIPELKKFSEDYHLKYEILTVSDLFRKYSPKFEALCLFKIQL